MNEAVQVRVAERIRELRLEAGLSQRQVAKRIKSHREIVARMESGRHTLTLETVARLAHAFECQLVDILVVLDTHPQWDVARGCWRGMYVEGARPTEEPPKGEACSDTQSQS